MTKPSFLGKRILVLTAHPDDEQLAAGTMYENHRAGGETFLICATSGEKGKSHLAKPMSDRALARVREKELSAAAKVLGVDKVFFLHFPDGKVRENEAKLYAKSLKIVKATAPEQILSFGPDGVSAHWDHITAGAVALRIAKKLKIPLAAFTLSNKMILARKKRKQFFLARRKFGVYADAPEHRQHDIRVKISSAMKRKAMALHTSQFGTTGKTWFDKLPKGLKAKMFEYEYFVDEKVVKKV